MAIYHYSWFTWKTCHNFPNSVQQGCHSFPWISSTVDNCLQAPHLERIFLINCSRTCLMKLTQMIRYSTEFNLIAKAFPLIGQESSKLDTLKSWPICVLHPVKKRILHLKFSEASTYLYAKFRFKVWNSSKMSLDFEAKSSLETLHALSMSASCILSFVFWLTQYMFTIRSIVSGDVFINSWWVIDWMWSFLTTRSCSLRWCK